MLAKRDRDCLRFAVDVELREDVLDVLRGGLTADAEPAGDFRACIARNEKRENLSLALRELRPRVAPRACGEPSGPWPGEAEAAAGGGARGRPLLGA